MSFFKMMSYWIRLGPKSNVRCPDKKRSRHTDSEGRGRVKTEADIEAILLQGRSHQKLERGKEGSSPRVFRESMSLPTP